MFNPPVVSHHVTFWQLRHVFGVETKGAKPVFNLSPLLTSLDGPILAASSSFWAVPWVGGGGPVYVSPVSAAGKVSVSCHRVAHVALVVFDLGMCELAPFPGSPFAFAAMCVKSRAAMLDSVLSVCHVVVVACLKWWLPHFGSGVKQQGPFSGKHRHAPGLFLVCFLRPL